MAHGWLLKRAFGIAWLAILVQGTNMNMLEVSVCQDATFQIPTSRGGVCSGNGPKPQGVECPRIGDTAWDNCHPYFDSYEAGDCVAKEDAQCVYLDGRNAWGCTFPSTRCMDERKNLDETGLHKKCPTWNYLSEHALFTENRDSFHVANNWESIWFVKTNLLRELDNCKGDTHKEQVTASFTTTSGTPIYTTAPQLSVTRVKALLAAAEKIPPNPVKSLKYTNEIHVTVMTKQSPVAAGSASSMSTDVYSSSMFSSESSDTENISKETAAVTTSCTSNPTTEKHILMLSETSKHPKNTKMSTVSPITGDFETLAPIVSRSNSLIPSTVLLPQTQTPLMKTIDAPATSAIDNATLTSLNADSKPLSSDLEITEQNTITARRLVGSLTEMPQDFGSATPLSVQNYTKGVAISEPVSLLITSRDDSDLKPHIRNVKTRVSLNSTPSTLLRDCDSIGASTEISSASDPYGSKNERTTLQASTKADFVTITSVGISAVAVVIIVIAIGSIIVVTIALFRARCGCDQTRPVDPEDCPYDHSIVLTPSEAQTRV